jgi:hypothetical protein
MMDNTSIFAIPKIANEPIESAPICSSCQAKQFWNKVPNTDLQKILLLLQIAATLFIIFFALRKIKNII